MRVGTGAMASSRLAEMPDEGVSRVGGLANTLISARFADFSRLLPDGWNWVVLGRSGVRWQILSAGESFGGCFGG